MRRKIKVGMIQWVLILSSLALLSTIHLVTTPVSSESARPGCERRNQAYASANQVCPLPSGESIPDVNIQTADGQRKSLKSVMGSQPALLVFYRGGWCPYCNLHLKELKDIEKKVVGQGYQIFAISPDSPQELKKSQSKHKGHYTLLSDASMEAAKGFGLAFQADYKKLLGYGHDLEKASGGKKHHLLPVPGVYLVGASGQVQYNYVNPNYKERLSGRRILREIAKHSQTP